MKVKKFKAISVAICFAVTSLWTEIQCMDRQEISEIQEQIRNITRAVQGSLAHHPDAKSVIVLGSTGSGKSTLINLLAGKPFVTQVGNMEIKVHTNDPLPGFNIGAGNSVGTKAPCSWFDPEINAVFWDCPGFGDPRGSKSDIINAFSIHELFRPNSKILLVVDASNLKVNRATGFLKLLNELIGLFPDNQEVKQSLSMVFSKTSPIQNILDYLRDDILTLNQVDQIELTPDVRGVLNFIVTNPQRISSFPCPVGLGEYAPNIQPIKESIHSASYMVNPRPQIRIFGDSLLYVDSLSDNLNNYLTDHVKMNIHTSIVRHCNNLMGNQMLPIEELINTFRSFERNLEDIKNIVAPENPNAFPESLHAIFDNNLNVEDIKNTIENIYFLKKIKHDIAYRTADWTNALLPTIGRIQKLTYKLENRKDIQELKDNLSALQEANRVIPELKRGLQELKAENDSLKNQLVSITTNHSQELNSRFSALQHSFTQENNILKSQISSPTPCGAVIYISDANPPQGYLKANGSEILRGHYHSLFSIIGTRYGSGNGSTTFNLPDLRGEFIRCWDDGRNIDTGRSLGSCQKDSVGAHDHRSYRGGDRAGWVDSYLGVGAPNHIANFERRTEDNPTGETKPRNVSLLACIKY